MSKQTDGVLEEVAAERDRQDAKFGEQNHGDGLRMALPGVLISEYRPPGSDACSRTHIRTPAQLGVVIERAGRSLLDGRADEGGTGTLSTWVGILLEEVGELLQAKSHDLRDEVIQTGAVCVSWAEAIDRRPGGPADRTDIATFTSPPHHYHPSVAHLLQFFKYAHLPPHLQKISKPFADLAHATARSSANPETAAALRKLMEAKDCAVRAALAAASDEAPKGAQD